MNDDKILEECGKIERELFQKQAFIRVIENIMSNTEDTPVRVTVKVDNKICSFDAHPWDKEKILDLLKFRYRLSKEMITTYMENINIMANTGDSEEEFNILD